MPSNLPPGVSDADIEDAVYDACSECGSHKLFRNSNLCRQCWEIERADIWRDQQRDEVLTRIDK